MQVKIVELYRTVYFYKSLLVDLNYLFGAVTRIKRGEDYVPNEGSPELGRVYAACKAGEDIVFDLAGAKLTSDANLTILNAQREGIKFTDTTNPNRLHLLQLNEERLAVSKDGWEPIPEFTYRTDLKEYITSLKTDVVYTLDTLPDKIAVALTCMITILRPSVQLCVDRIQNILFKYIATKVPTKDLLDDTEFFYYTDNGVDVISPGKSVYVQEIQESLPIEEAVKYGIIIPKKFGTKCLFKQEVWDVLFQSAYAIIIEYQESRPKRLSELYEV